MELHAYSWKGRRVAVTGATGFIGYHLCRLLVSLATDVTAIVRASSDTSRLRELGIRCKNASLDQPNQIADACRDCKFLFHLAGAVDFNNDWEHCRRVNVEGTANVLKLPPEPASSGWFTPARSSQSGQVGNRFG